MPPAWLMAKVRLPRKALITRLESAPAGRSANVPGWAIVSVEIGPKWGPGGRCGLTRRTMVMASTPSAQMAAIIVKAQRNSVGRTLTEAAMGKVLCLSIIDIFIEYR